MQKVIFPIFLSRVVSKPLGQMFVAFLAIPFLIAAAKIQIPMYPVPMTLQTLLLLLLPGLIGIRTSMYAIMGYLVLGAFGLPVFAGTPERGIGLAYMVGPTGGFLVGFAAMVAVVGFALHKKLIRGFFSALAVSIVATGILYVLGVVWLGAVIGFDKALLHLAVFPFLLGDAAKVCLAALFYASRTKINRVKE